MISKRQMKSQQTRRRENIRKRRFYGEERGTGIMAARMGFPTQRREPATLKTRLKTRETSFQYKAKSYIPTEEEREKARMERRATLHGFKNLEEYEKALKNIKDFNEITKAKSDKGFAIKYRKNICKIIRRARKRITRRR